MALGAVLVSSFALVVARGRRRRRRHANARCDINESAVVFERSDANSGGDGGGVCAEWFSFVCAAVH